MGLSFTNIPRLSSSVHFTHIAGYWKCLPFALYTSPLSVQALRSRSRLYYESYTGLALATDFPYIDSARTAQKTLRNLTNGHREPSSQFCLLDCLQNCCPATNCNIRYWDTASIVARWNAFTEPPPGNALIKSITVWTCLQCCLILARVFTFLHQLRHTNTALAFHVAIFS
jgi:hypothetical protein